MTFGSWRCWTAIGFLALTACNGEGTTRESASESEALGAGASSDESAFAAAGQAALNPEELDRLLDALEAELKTQEGMPR